MREHLILDNPSYLFITVTGPQNAHHHWRNDLTYSGVLVVVKYSEQTGSLNTSKDQHIPLPDSPGCPKQEKLSSGQVDLDKVLF